MIRIESLRFDRVTVRFEDGFEPFRDLSVEFPMNATVQLRGAAGCGKSTLLRMLGGLVEPCAGTYAINGVSVGEMSFEEFNPYRRAIGFGFEYGGLLANRTIRQNLMLPFFYHRDVSADEAEARVADFSHRFGLGPVLELRPASVSGGLKKAACVARALITRPQLLLLDNPLAGLDSRTRDALVETVAELREKGTLRHVIVAGELPEGIAGSDAEPAILEIQDQRIMRAA